LAPTTGTGPEKATMARPTCSFATVTSNPPAKPTGSPPTTQLAPAGTTTINPIPKSGAGRSTISTFPTAPRFAPPKSSACVPDAVFDVPPKTRSPSVRPKPRESLLNAHSNSRQRLSPLNLSHRCRVILFQRLMCHLCLLDVPLCPG